MAPWLAHRWLTADQVRSGSMWIAACLLSCRNALSPSSTATARMNIRRRRRLWLIGVGGSVAVHLRLHHCILALSIWRSSKLGQRRRCKYNLDGRVSPSQDSSLLNFQSSFITATHWSWICTSVLDYALRTWASRLDSRIYPWGRDDRPLHFIPYETLQTIKEPQRCQTIMLAEPPDRRPAA